jgi:hypothetical protein
VTTSAQLTSPVPKCAADPMRQVVAVLLRVALRGVDEAIGGEDATPSNPRIVVAWGGRYPIDFSEFLTLCSEVMLPASAHTPGGTLRRDSRFISLDIPFRRGSSLTSLGITDTSQLGIAVACCTTATRG